MFMHMTDYTYIDNWIKTFFIGAIILPVIAIGPMNIGWVIYLVLELISQTLTVVVFPVLTIIISLITILSNLILPLTCLFIAGIFSCPAENSFDAWLKSFVALIMENENSCSQKSPVDTIESTSIKSNKWFFQTYFEKIYNGVSNYLFRQVAVITLTSGTKKNFHCGGFRLVIIEMESGKKPIIFVGAFNTWFPSPYQL